MDPKFKQLIGRHGVLAAVRHLGFRAVNLLTSLVVYRGLVVTMQSVNQGLLLQDEGRFLTTAELEQFGENPENDLDPAFLRAASSRGDQCYAFVEGDVLSSYGWYAMYSPAVVGTTRVHFSSSYAFRYKGFTHPHFRGRQLRSIGMARALEALSRDGKKGLISLVGFEDLDSLASCQAVGFQLFGHALLLPFGDRVLTHTTSGCHAYRFRLASGLDAPAGIRVGERGTIGLDPRTE